MSDQVLYRKYRSASFDQIVGQDHVVSTLTAAIANGRLSHAYLFTGPRGTGKTSVARLLARAVNCTGNPKPCNACPNCLAAINSSLDVIEIDAASNRSIDAVRELKDKIALAPTIGAYKIYIIDEVHMLTAEAFNALLKTLEEPPSHAVFVLATTEAHKLPDTIISRTQRFNFRPIGSADMTSHLKDIAAAEKFEVEPAALAIIADAARGSFRDGISLLDQLAATGAVTETAARQLLGYSSAGELAELSRAIAASDIRAAFEILKRLESSGAQAGQTAVQLADWWRQMLLISSGALTSDNPELTALAQTVPPATAARVITTLLEVTRSHWPALALEAAVAQLTAATPIPTAAPAAAATKPAVTTQAPSINAKPAPKPATTSNPEPAAATPNGQLPANLWPKVLVLLKSQNNSLCALLQMYPVEFGGEDITIKPRFNFHRDLFLKPANLRLIEAAAAKVYGSPVKFFARTDEAAAAKPRAKADPSAELVSSALEILGGEVIE